MRVVKIEGDIVSKIEKWVDESISSYPSGTSREELLRWSIGLGRAIYSDGGLVSPVYIDERNERMKTLGLLFPCEGFDRVLKPLLSVANEHGITRVGEVFFSCRSEGNLERILRRIMRDYQRVNGYRLSELNVIPSRFLYDEPRAFIEVGYVSERNTITPYEYVMRTLNDVAIPLSSRRLEEMRYLISEIVLRETNMGNREDVDFLRRLNSESFRNYEIFPSDDERVYIVEMNRRRVAAIGTMEMPNGIIEISYAVLPTEERKGIATAAISRYLRNRWDGIRIVYADCMHDRSLKSFERAFSLYDEGVTLSVGVHYAQLDAWARGMNRMYGFEDPGRGYITTFAAYITRNSYYEGRIKTVHRPLIRW